MPYLALPSVFLDAAHEAVDNQRRICAYPQRAVDSGARVVKMTAPTGSKGMSPAARVAV
jgi:hypothetical protein